MTKDELKATIVQSSGGKGPSREAEALLDILEARDSWCPMKVGIVWYCKVGLQ